MKPMKQYLMALVLTCCSSNSMENFIKAYNDLKEEDPEKSVELLKKMDSDALKEVVLDDNFYDNFFDELLKRLLSAKAISRVSEIVEVIPELSQHQADQVSQKWAQAFYNLFKTTEAAESQKFNLVIELLPSELGNKILSGWLQLDKELPFITGTYTTYNTYGASYTSAMDFMQKMLLEYAMREFEYDFGVPRNLEIYKDATKKFVQAWKNGGGAEKEGPAKINHAPLAMGGHKPGMENRYIESAHLTTAELAKRIKLEHLFKDALSDKSNSIVDQFAGACKEISLEA